MANVNPFDVLNEIDSEPVETKKTESGPVETKKTESGPVETKPVESGLVENGKVSLGSVETKKVSLEQKSKDVTIITHDLSFHSDDVFSCMVIKELNPDAVIVRSRDPAIVSTGTFCVDVGKVFDPDRHRYDHHQEGFDLKYDPKDKRCLTLMSSAGLVFKHFGRQFIEKIVDLRVLPEPQQFLDNIYYMFIQEIDAVDNGILPQFLNYSVYTSLTFLVSRLNDYDPTKDPEDQLKRFLKAMDLTREIITALIISEYKIVINQYHDYDLIEKAMEARDHQEFIVVKESCPGWKRCVRDYEFDHRNDHSYHPIKFIVNRVSQEWHVHAISNKMKSRKLIMTQAGLIKGKRVTHPENIIFVHPQRFIAGTKDLETALEIAKASV